MILTYPEDVIIEDIPSKARVSNSNQYQDRILTKKRAHGPHNNIRRATCSLPTVCLRPLFLSKGTSQYPIRDILFLDPMRHLLTLFLFWRDIISFKFHAFAITVTFGDTFANLSIATTMQNIFLMKCYFRSEDKSTKIIQDWQTQTPFWRCSWKSVRNID